jgi:hypothetical protein
MSGARNTGSSGSEWPLVSAIAANGMVLAVLLVAALIHASSSDLYYRSAQEDGLLEWMTFWSFALAAVVFTLAGLQQHKATKRLPWFFWGVAAFCAFVALEEISWGQRLFGYLPPEYFLRENFQQELNVHNVFATSLRKLLLKAVILGYGVALPVLTVPKAGRRTLARLGITPPPLALMPAFLATFITYQMYPWSFAGEWVELMLGLGFLFAASAHYSMDEAVQDRTAQKHLKTVLIGFIATASLGLVSAALSLLRPSDTPSMTTAAQTELQALARDFIVDGRPASRCGVHKRVYSFVEKYDRDHLYEGEYSRLVEQGLPEERADYFLDPWNSPIWVRHKCEDRTRKQILFVYSFGADRRRDSSSWEILGDDVGVVVLERGL